MNIYQKLQEARIRLQNTELKKSGHNKFAGYKYFELADFLPAVQNIFADLGLCGVVSFEPELATLTIYDETNAIVITSPMAEAQLKGCHPIQNLGAVETYQRRYLWVTAMEIVEHDILDATSGQDVKESSKSISKSVYDEQPIEIQHELHDIAMEVMAVTPSEGLVILDSYDLDADKKTALWSLFDSKTRAALKKAKGDDV